LTLAELAIIVAVTFIALLIGIRPRNDNR